MGGRKGSSHEPNRKRRPFKTRKKGSVTTADGTSSKIRELEQDLEDDLLRVNESSASNTCGIMKHLKAAAAHLWAPDYSQSLAREQEDLTALGTYAATLEAIADTRGVLRLLHAARLP